MSADAIKLDGEFGIVAGDVRTASTRPPDRAFRAALGVAMVLHASLLIGALGAKSKRLGEEGGADDAINVSLVTEADFLSRTTVPENSSPPPGAPPQPAPQPAAEPPPPDMKQTLPVEEKPPPVQPAPEATAAPQPEPTPPAPKPEPVKPADIAATPDLFQLSEVDASKPKSEEAKPKTEAAKPAPKPPAKKPPQQQKTAKLDLSPPKPTFDAPPGAAGRSAGFSRPPGITRSGANDDFARGVIRALQQTMPQLRETLGRVTIKIVLNENGNVKDIQITRPSPDTSLNQSVVFAARQTSYPFPPAGSIDVDRVFVVTYIYN